MKTALISHADCLDHVTPPGHPEQVARMDAVWGALEGMDLLRVQAPHAAEDDLLRVHPRAYLESLRRAAPTEGWVSLDADTRRATPLSRCDRRGIMRKHPRRWGSVFWAMLPSRQSMRWTTTG